MSRHSYDIEKLVAERGTVSVAEAARLLGVSDQTVRRAIRPLVEAGRLRKVHGAVTAAQAPAYAPFLERMDQMRAEKRAIAARLAAEIPDGASLAIDTGSTSGFLAQALSTRRNLRVVTNSAFVAATLAMRPGNAVFMAGSRLRDRDGAAFDAAAFATIARMRAEIAILSASAVDPGRGFLVHESCEADIAQAMRAIADRAVMCVDHSKFSASHTSAMYVALGFASVDLLATDRPLPGGLARLCPETLVAEAPP